VEVKAVLRIAYSNQKYVVKQMLSMHINMALVFDLLDAIIKRWHQDHC
jgi:hypothetical protein